jgi:signal transduction histidine kinase
VLSVINTGALIPPDEVGRLFQPFQRLERRRANYKNGHGLGLSIVRAIARAHGATITAESELGGGLSVKVVFPQSSNPHQTRRRHQPALTAAVRAAEAARPGVRW